MELSQTKIIFIAYIVSACYLIQGEGDTIGVVNGKMGDLPSEDEVVPLLKSNKIGKYRIYKQEPVVFNAFANSGIEITVGVANFDLEKIASSQNEANKWIADNIVAYPATNFKYIAVGNQPFDNSTNLQSLLGAMTNIQTALQNTNLEKKIKVSSPHGVAVIANKTSPPSNATFQDPFRDNMTSFLQFLQEQGSPFMVNVYPYQSLMKHNYSLDYALFRSTSPVMIDGNFKYTNLFDTMVDRFYGAMEALGFSTIPIVITETGWPSKGNDVATIPNARIYHNNLIKHVLSNAGTPRRPGNSIETYIYGLFNEDKIQGSEADRNYGLFDPRKQPVYNVNFSPELNYSFPADFIPRVTLLLYIDM